MGFRDTLNSLADRFHIGSENYNTRDTQMPEEQYDYAQPYGTDSYAGYQEGSSYGYQDYQPQYGYQEEPEYEEPDDSQFYESGYGSGGGYVSAGARPRSAPQNRGKGTIKSFLDRLRGGKQEPQRSYAAPRQPQPNNVVPINRNDYDARQDYGARQPYGQPEYDEPEIQEEPSRQMRQPSRQTTMIYLVRRLEDAEEIIAHMLEGGSVIVNMEEVEETLKRRVLDVVSGAAFALEASIKRISYRNYYVAMSGEEIVSNVSMRDREPVEEIGYRSGGRDRRY